MGAKLSKIGLISAILLVLALPVLAHQPRIVSGEGILKIQNPEISQAFYGELKGDAQSFEIDAEKSFDLYVNILVPDLPDINTSFFVEIYKANSLRIDLVASLDGMNYAWQKFYEPFGGDNYLKGPEFEKQVEAGKYLITVSSGFNSSCHPEQSITPCLENIGKYSLAIGKIESFPPKEILKTILILPQLKKDFFGKSPFSAYLNYTGLILIGFLIIVAIIIFLVIFILRKRKNKKAIKTIEEIQQK